MHVKFISKPTDVIIGGFSKSGQVSITKMSYNLIKLDETTLNVFKRFRNDIAKKI